jgi:hypothetical protein
VELLDVEPVEDETLERLVDKLEVVEVMVVLTELVLV